MGASVSKLRKPIKRKLEATTNGRPWFIEVDPAGFVTVWPRRGKPEPIHVEAVYIHARRLRLDRERQRKKKGKL